MNRNWIKKALVVSILVYIVISWYLLNSVEPPVNAMLIAILTPFFAGFAGVVIKMVSILFENSEKRRYKRISLKSKLNEIIKYSFNDDNQSPLIDNSIKLINLPKHPPKIEQKIAEYNKKAEDLIDLFTGCGYLVIDMVIKNVLKHLSKIEVRTDGGNNIIPWTMRDYGGEQKLSDLLKNVLKDRIIRGDDVNKSLFENIDSSFYGKVVQSPSSPEDFEDFLRGLGIDIKYQRQYGCLKLLARVHKEAEKLAKDLQGDKYLKIKRD